LSRNTQQQADDPRRAPQIERVVPRARTPTATTPHDRFPN
jgi:hypothetical protein